jgi:hypothetical protein
MPIVAPDIGPNINASIKVDASNGEIHIRANDMKMSKKLIEEMSKGPFHLEFRRML